MVTDLLVLSKLQIRALFTTILGRSVPDETVPLQTDEKLFLLLADLLEKLAFLKPEQRTLVLTEVRAHQPDIDCNDCLNQLVFADNRYSTWTSNVGWLDLETGETLTKLPHPPMETIGYNLNELIRRATLHIEKRSGLHAKKPDAANLDQP